MVNKDMISVVRYERPFEFEVGKYGENSNLYGITILYEINYNTQLVKAKWSVCNGDNFSKKIGKSLAEKSDVSWNFNLDLVTKYGSLKLALFEVLVDLLEDEYNPCDFEDALSLFLRSTRKLKSN